MGVEVAVLHTPPADSVWLDLGGGMEPDDVGWEAIIQAIRHTASRTSLDRRELGTHTRGKVKLAEGKRHELEVLWEGRTGQEGSPGRGAGQEMVAGDRTALEHWRGGRRPGQEVLAGGSLRVMGGPRKR